MVHQHVRIITGYKRCLELDISPNSSYADRVFGVDGDDDLSGTNTLYRVSVRPSLYLKSNVKIVSGLGTKDNMFKLEI